MGRYISPSASTTGTATTSTTAFCNYLPAAPRSPFTNRCIYDSPGTYCFTVPSGVCTIRVVTVGGGGASCSRVDPDPLEIPAFTCQTLCCWPYYNSSGMSKIYTCLVSLSDCSNYCNCPACGSVGIQSAIFLGVCSCCSPECGCITCYQICGDLCIKFMPQVGNPSVGTTYKIETCMVTAQRVTAPSGGYADGCLSVTPGCAYTVTVASPGGTSGFGTFISATGGSVAITQRPLMCCSPYWSCVLVCGTDASCNPVAISTNLFNYNCTFYLWNCGHCFIHRYENCCAQATLTAGVGTAWSGMCNVIVRSGAAGTVFDIGESFVSQTVSGLTNRTLVCYNTQACGITYCPGCIYSSSPCRYQRYLSFAYKSSDPVTFTGVSTSYNFKRRYGGGSAGNYFGDGIPTTDYTDYVPLNNANHTTFAACYGCCIGGNAAISLPGTPAIFSTCGVSLGYACYHQISLISCWCQTFSSNCIDCCRLYGPVGGAGIRTPGNFALSGSGRSPACCAYVPDSLKECCFFNFKCGVDVYYPLDDVTLPDSTYCATAFPVACACPNCIHHIPNTISGSCYWYPEDMNGHSNFFYGAWANQPCVTCKISCVERQAGSGAYALTCNTGNNYCDLPDYPLCAGVLGGGLRKYSQYFCNFDDMIGNCPCSRCAESFVVGGSIGHPDAFYAFGAITCCGDNRCIPGGKGLVIVYY